MSRKSYVWFVVVSAAVFVAGLALGAGKGSEDTSLANTASKILLTVGLLAVIASSALELLFRHRHRALAQR